MKSKLLLIACIACSLVLPSNQAMASHAAGGELIYVPVNDSVYKIVFKLFRDCSGIQEPATIQLCVKNPSDTSKSFRGVLTKAQPFSQNGEEVPYLCGNVTSTCNNGTYFGMRAWYYEALVTLGSKCSNWTFAVSISARNPSANLNVGDLYVEAVLDNLNFAQNTSPTFMTTPHPASCALNTPYTFHHNGLDVDGDSLAYELIAARTNSDCNQPSLLAYRPGYSYTAPLPSNSFSLNTSTGQLSFNATAVGLYVVVIKCNEYRNGQLIGSIMRDMNYNVVSCTVSIPKLELDTTSTLHATYQNRVVVAYADTPFMFCFDGISTSSMAALHFTTDTASSLPGASITYTGLGTNTARGCVLWKAAASDTGYRVLRVTVLDSTCNPFHISYPITTLIPIQILPALSSPIPNAIPTVSGNGQALIFPNPTSGSIQVNVASKAILTITSIEGRQVGSYTIAEKENIDLSLLANGLYLIKIQNNQSGELMLSEKLVLRK